MQFDNVAYEVQAILLRIRDYKKLNNIPMSQQLALIFQEATLSSILTLEDNDEQMQIALVNFYSKLMYYEQVTPDMLHQILDNVSKINQQQHIYLEKKLKCIRNAFEYHSLDISIVKKLYQLNKSVENLPNLLIKELARDQLSQSIKQLSKSCSQEILEYLLEELTTEILHLLNLKSQETVKLIEYPFSIIMFIMRTRKPHDYIIVEFIPLIIKLTKLDHSVIWNSLWQAFQIIIEFSMSNHFDDVLETRTLLGQVVLKSIKSHIKKLSQLTVIEQSLPCEIDTHLLIRFLQSILNSKESIAYFYLKSDYNPFLQPIFTEILQNIFELSRVLSKLTSDEGKSLQKQLYELQVSLFKNGLTKKCQVKFDTYQAFLADFNSEEPGPRRTALKYPKQGIVNILKYCTQIKETHMIEVLGYHKEQYIDILQEYIDRFEFTGLSIVSGFRLLISNFLLFGESQMIERVLNAFTIRYYEQNKDNSTLKNADCFFTYTYALIMLNTDLYNKTLVKHMSLEEFKKNCDRVNDGASPPEWVLEQDYNDLLENEMKCIRDFAKTNDDIPKFVWKQYLLNKVSIQQHYQELCVQFEVQVDPDHYGDIVLTQMVHNIQEMVNQVKDLNELTTFLSQIIQVCINNDKLEHSQQILISMVNLIKEQKEYQSVHLYTCFYIAEQLLPYTVQFQTVVELIIVTTDYRHTQGTDSISKECRSILTKIYSNNKFTKKEMGSNKGIFNIFQKFLQQDEEDQDDGQEVILKDIPVDIASTESRNHDLLTKLILQTKYLDQERLNEFLNLLLQQIDHIEDFKKDYIKFAQITYIAVEILHVNTDRLLEFWPKVIDILTISKTYEAIHNLPIRKLVMSYCEFILLKLVIEFLHKAEHLDKYEDCYLRGLQYLGDQSIEILVEFLQEISTFVKCNSVVENTLVCLTKTFGILGQVLNVLEQKTLDKNDAIVIVDIIQDIFERIQQYESETDIVPTLKLQLDFLNKLLKQQQLSQVNTINEFIAKNLITIMNSYEHYIHEQNNSFLNELLMLACSLSNEHLQKIVQVMIQITLNYNYSQINEEQFIQLYQKILSKLPQVLATKNDQIIANYVQMLYKSYFNWVSIATFSLRLWTEVLTKLSEVLSNLKANKIMIKDVICISLQGAYQNAHFQEIINKQKNAQEIIDKTKSISKYYQLELL